MKIRAIRLKEVGRFRDAIALEGLSGELDVLAGPNELGKSTILKAVKLALFEKHTSNKKEIEAIRPYWGGAPLIEVDLEIDGKTWRVRKQYLSGRAAELRELPSGTIARGADAETELGKLLAGTSGAQRLELLWVDQGTSLVAVDPSQTVGSALVSVIEGEVESVADGGVARAVQARVSEALAELVTGHSMPRPAGRYKEAREELQLLEGRRAEAQRHFEAAEARLDRLQQIRNEMAGIADAEAAARRSLAAEAAATAFEQAKIARDKCRQAEEAVPAQEKTAGALKATLAELQNKITDLGKLEELESRAAPELAGCARKVADAQKHAEDARKRGDEIKSALIATEKERKALEHAAHFAKVTKSLEIARASHGECKRLNAELSANGTDENLIKAVRREAHSVATISARLSAAAPIVTIAYARDGAGKIKAGGQPLEDGETLNPTSPLTLEIDGIGTITVAPGQSEGVADDAVDLAAHEKQLAALLQRAGASSVEEAESRAAERREVEAKLAEADRDLKRAAPDGIERLERTHAQLAEAASKGDAPTRTREELEAAGHELQGRLDDAEAQLSETAKAYAQARETLVQMQTRAEQRRERIEALAANLGDAAARNSAQEKQGAAVAEAEATLNRAVRELAAWRETALDPEPFAALEMAAKRAEVARAESERRLTELRRAEAGFEGELKSDRAEDVESRLAELDEACVRAGARVADLEEEIAALQLLSRELDAAATATREHFAKPVIERLAPYLELVFPAAKARFGEGLALEKLERSGALEDIGKLSEGTQEQLAVLVRLGFGRLLAERGAPVPLILDDALVYADDRRIEQMFEALKLAARSHQVLVLTCRERTFAALGGHRIAIESWC